jgi:hypothetical protein
VLKSETCVLQKLQTTKAYAGEKFSREKRESLPGRAFLRSEAEGKTTPMPF